MADEAQTQISVATDVTFGFSRDDAPYSLAYVLTEDGVTGPRQQAWMQYNEFSGQADIYNDPELYEFTHGERYMQLTYNHVGIGAWGLTTGVAGSIATPVVADRRVTHNYVLDIAGYSQIQHKDQLNVVALLLNTETGIIVNAATVRVGAGTETGISCPASEIQPPTPPVCYNLAGQRVDADYKGVVIMNGKKYVNR